MRWVVSVLIFMLLFGCAPMKGASPKIKLPQNYVESTSHSSQSSYRWWQRFGNKELDRLVDEALKNNSDIKAAAEKVLEMAAEFSGSSAALFPSLYANFNAMRQRENIKNNITGSYERFYSNSFHLSLSASYEIDLWRRLSSSEKAAKAALLQSIENRTTIVHAVISDVVDLYLELSSIKKRLEILKKENAILQKELQLQKRRYESGISSLDEFVKAQTALEDNRMEISDLLSQFYDKKNNLMNILERYEDIRITRFFDFRKKAPPVLSDLPSSLLLKRPDIREKLLRVKQMKFLLKSAHWARFPQIKLTGSYGNQSDELKNLLKPETLLWQIASGITAPIFDAGKLRSVETASLHRYNQAVIDYAKTVLGAFREVQEGLRNNKILLDKRRYAETLLKDSKLQADIAYNRYKTGLEGLTNLYSAQLNYLKARDLLNQTLLAFYLNRVTLHKALGGKWLDKR